MISGLIALFGAMAPLFVAWVLRRWSQDTPRKRHENEVAKIHDDIARGDCDAVNVRLECDLARLQNARGGNTKRKNSVPTPGG